MFNHYTATTTNIQEISKSNSTPSTISHPTSDQFFNTNENLIDLLNYKITKSPASKSPKYSEFTLSDYYHQQWSTPSKKYQKEFVPTAIDNKDNTDKNSANENRQDAYKYSIHITDIGLQEADFIKKSLTWLDDEL